MYMIFNCAHNNTNFYLEDKYNINALNILDVNIRITEGGLIATKFYEKKAKRGIFINALSHVPQNSHLSALSLKESGVSAHQVGTKLSHAINLKRNLFKMAAHLPILINLI